MKLISQPTPNVAYWRIGGRQVMRWTIGGVTKDFQDWCKDSGVIYKTAANRWSRLRGEKLFSEITEADLRDCLDTTKARPGPPPAKPKGGRKERDEWIRHRGEPFVYQLNHLLALGCPVAIRAEFARRMVETV